MSRPNGGDKDRLGPGKVLVFFNGDGYWEAHTVLLPSCSGISTVGTTPANAYNNLRKHLYRFYPSTYLTVQNSRKKKS